MTYSKNNRLSHKQIESMMLAGACGDALGAPIEFKSYERIISASGPVRDFSKAYGKIGAITDDTQMLLWTAEGMLRYAHAKQKQEVDPIACIWKAYLRWYATQYGSKSNKDASFVDYNGYLWGQKDMHSSRAPGTTCLGGMRQSLLTKQMGTLQHPAHPGAGCGVIMRIAPISIFWTGDEAFERGLQAGVLTHGEPGAFLAGGFYAALLSEVGRGMSIEDSIQNNLQRCQKIEGHQRITSLVEQAVELAKTAPGQVGNLHALGGAWRGDEALALTVYAILSFPKDLEEAVVFAVNHSGDSDSTGSTVGNMMGMLYPDAIPTRWLQKLELRETIEKISHDLYLAAENQEFDMQAYPIES